MFVLINMKLKLSDEYYSGVKHKHDYETICGTQVRIRTTTVVKRIRALCDTSSVIWENSCRLIIKKDLNKCLYFIKGWFSVKVKEKWLEKGTKKRDKRGHTWTKPRPIVLLLISRDFDLIIEHLVDWYLLSSHHNTLWHANRATDAVYHNV